MKKTFEIWTNDEGILVAAEPECGEYIGDVEEGQKFLTLYSDRSNPEWVEACSIDSEIDIHDMEAVKAYCKQIADDCTDGWDDCKYCFHLVECYVDSDGYIDENWRNAVEIVEVREYMGNDDTPSWRDTKDGRII